MTGQNDWPKWLKIHNLYQSAFSIIRVKTTVDGIWLSPQTNNFPATLLKMGVAFNLFEQYFSYKSQVIYITMWQTVMQNINVGWSYTDVYKMISLDCSTLPLIRTLYSWVLSKEVSSSIFKAFGMTRSGIEPMALETWVQSRIESYQRLKKWYLMPPFLTQ